MMTSYERFSRAFQHKEADRVPIVDYPWPATLERWHKEGLPENVDYNNYFGMDRIIEIVVDSSPRFPTKVLEETNEYIIETTAWGATMKNWKHSASTPQFLDFKIKDRASWAEAKELMIGFPDRLPWDWMHNNYGTWREKGYWIRGDLWFGFDAAHSWAVGTDRVLMAMVEDPEWCIDMFQHFFNVSIDLLDIVWDAGYRYDSAVWCDDMGYKGKQFFSVDMYRELLKPIQKQAVEWAHEKGIPITLHSCGDVNPFIPELIEIGVDALNPIEVKAGMDPIGIKKQYGDKLTLHGGINALLYDDIEALEAEMRRVIPALKQNGGYILSSDHSIPSSISLKDFGRFMELAKELGSF